MSSTIDQTIPPTVLDASALGALLFSEAGAEHVRCVIAGSVISAVNLSEIAAKAMLRGAAVDVVQGFLEQLPVRILPFDDDQVLRTASLAPATRVRGLSFGDRACLALGIMLQAVVITADRAWLGLDVGVEIRLIR